MLLDLRQFVEIESPSDNKAAVDQMGVLLAQKFADCGGRVTRHPQTAFGDHLQIEFPGSAGLKPVLLLGHFDTVWPLGTLVKMPCRVENGRLRGPGVFDMKAGIVMMIYALLARREAA